MAFVGDEADDMIGTDHMTCREFADFLDQYMAGTLDAERRGAFDAHLGECSDCVKYLSSYRRTIELAKQAMGDADAPSLLEMPAGLKKAILTARKAK
jgi:anti-sigma factor RsiW